MSKKTQVTMGEYTEQFWNSLKDYQRGFLSLTQNHRKYFPSDKNWNELTKYQQNVIFNWLWRDCKRQSRQSGK